MLMDVPQAERFAFLLKVTQGARREFVQTQAGDPAKQDWWRAHQPMLYAAARIEEHRGTSL